MSLGHDGYIYEVMKNYLPMESLYMLRYHSFYAWHRHGAYDYLCNEQDRAMLPWVLKFNPYDLYSKGHTKPDFKQLKPYYDDLFAEFFSGKNRLVNRFDAASLARRSTSGRRHGVEWLA